MVDLGAKHASGRDLWEFVRDLEFHLENAPKVWCTFWTFDNGLNCCKIRRLRLEGDTVLGLHFELVELSHQGWDDPRVDFGCLLVG